MFERFTGKARHAIVLAQEEARLLHHNYIGTEHVLLGLLGEPDSIAARAARGFGLTLETGRDDVLAIIGRGKKAPTGHIPFTPRAKKCLELALREALALRHDYIGTEHVLLGIIREGDGVGAKILAQRAGGLDAVRLAVLELVPAATAPSRWPRLRSRRPGSDPGSAAGPPPDDEPEDPHATPAAQASLREAALLAGTDPVGSHHLMLAALADPHSAAARTLTGLGLDLDQARAELRRADVTGSTDELPEDAGRRQMTVTVTGGRVTVEAADFETLQLGQAAIEAVAALASRTADPCEPAKAAKDGVIHGDQELAAGLAAVWFALREALADIRDRATAQDSAPSLPDAGPGQQAGPG
jgi:ATP-dependent Clp protease ATP-binding subunit ClpA